MPALENVAVAGLSVAALALVVVGVRAWWFTRATKVLLLVAAFLFFLAKGALYATALFTTPDWGQRVALPGVFLDLAALALIYASVLAPGRR